MTLATFSKININEAMFADERGMVLATIINAFGDTLAEDFNQQPPFLSPALCATDSAAT